MAVSIKCDLNFGLPVIAVLGTVYSLWVTNYIILALRVTGGLYISSSNQQLLKSAQYTYLLLCLGTSILLYRGFQNSDKKLIKYWFIQKWIESSFFILGFIIILSGWGKVNRNWLYLFVAVAILGLGWYILYTVKQGYNEICVELDSVKIPEVSGISISQEVPPPYDSIENKENNVISTS